MKKQRKKKPRPRLPIEAVLKLRSHLVAPKKGKKGYDRKRFKKLIREKLKEEDQVSTKIS